MYGYFSGWVVYLGASAFVALFVGPPAHRSPPRTGTGRSDRVRAWTRDGSLARSTLGSVALRAFHLLDGP
jgi:hypothetical protein